MTTDNTVLSAEERERISSCEGCSRPIYQGDRYHSGSDVALCETCSPTYADLVTDPSSFTDGDGEPLTKAAARKIVSKHIRSGGHRNDKMVRS